MKIDLTGRTAVITGASRGLGEAMANALAEAGARIALVARDIKRLEQVRESIAERGGTAAVFTADVTNESQVAALAASVKERFGHAQILINSAGINIRKNLVDFSLEEFRSVIDASLTSTFLMCRAFVPGMKGMGYGRILNGVSPGPIATDMNLPLINDPQINAQFVASIPVGRWGKVEEIGALACYLCSDAAGFITGTDILIDGGWTAR